MPKILRNREQLADAILARLEEGQFLSVICRAAGMPDRATFHRWLDDDESLRNRYARSREAGYALMAEGTIEIADGTGPDYNRDRLRVDARKWYLAHMHPEQWGHRQRLEHTGRGGRPIEVGGANGLTDDELAAIASGGVRTSLPSVEQSTLTNS